jgi:hypothetical protein
MVTESIRKLGQLLSQLRHKRKIPGLAIASLLSLSLSILIATPGRSQELFPFPEQENFNEFAQFKADYQRDLQLY